MTINIAIIGCGRIAGHHCCSIRSVSGLNLVSVCDLDYKKAEIYGNEFKVPFYINYKEMILRHPEIDTVAVITPSGMHYEHASEFITQYKKNVIIEKPTFLKLSHLLECYAAASKSNLTIFPVFQNRYNKSVQKVKLALENGELGKLQIASVRVRWCRTNSYYSLAPWRGTYSMDGGALTNQGIHHIDLLRYFAGEVESVSAQMRTFGSDIEVEDTVTAHVVFKTGAVGTIEITTAARPDNYEASLSLVCDKGLAQIGGIAVNELQIFTPEPKLCSEFSEDFSGNVYGSGHVKMYQDIENYFKNKISFPISKEDNIGSIQLLHAIYVSAENKGKLVTVAETSESINLGKESQELANFYRTKIFEAEAQ